MNISKNQRRNFEKQNDESRTIRPIPEDFDGLFLYQDGEIPAANVSPNDLYDFVTIAADLTTDNALLVDLAPDKPCGCATCLGIFSASEVRDYTKIYNTDHKKNTYNNTAVCPLCGAPTVIPSTGLVQLSAPLLSLVGKYLHNISGVSYDYLVLGQRLSYVAELKNQQRISEIENEIALDSAQSEADEADEYYKKVYIDCDDFS